MKEREFTFSATFSPPSPSSDLKVPFDEAEKRHETQLNALTNQNEENGDSENVASIRAENAVLPV